MATEALTDLEIEQFLTFELAGEAYGIEILKVQEIRGWESVREIPNTPDYIKGALNLRGEIVPIIDLRERFGMDKTEYSPITVVIVLCVEGSQGTNVMGIVADAVSDVLDITLADIKATPKLGSKIDTRYMRGMHVGKKQMVMLLDTDKLLDSEEFEGISSL
ncbi:MAG: chemotaxis protein CheW [Methylococcaceae bacterium]|nr:chemotaxis protein CheW [Methylococcaceae bacterium]